MHLLVLDGSLVLPALVRRLVPQGVVVEVASDFDHAVAVLAAQPPDAVIANVGPSDLPWEDLRKFCQEHHPKIPVLFESCVFRDAEEAGLGPLNHSAYFIRKPYAYEELRAQIRRLLDHAANAQDTPKTGTH